MKLETIMLSLILIGGFTLGLAGWYGALLAQYGVADNSPLSSQTLNITNQTYTKISESYDTMQSSSNNNTVSVGTNTQVSGPVNLVFGAYAAALLVLDTPKFFQSIITDLLSVAGFPSWVWLVVMGSIFIIILFSVIRFIRSGSE